MGHRRKTCQGLSHKPQDIDEIADALQGKWRRIPPAINGRLIGSVVVPIKAATLISTRAMGAVIVFVVVLLQVAGAGTLTAKFQVRCSSSSTK